MKTILVTAVGAPPGLNVVRELYEIKNQLSTRFFRKI